MNAKIQKRGQSQQGRKQQRWIHQKQRDVKNIRNATISMMNTKNSRDTRIVRKDTNNRSDANNIVHTGKKRDVMLTTAES
jgi:hypothetical protein